MDFEYNITYRKKNNGLQTIISYKDNNGKWKQKSKQGFSNTRMGKKNAKTWADEVLQEIKAINPVATELKDLTFESFVSMYKKSLSLSVSYLTMRGYNTSLKHFSALNNLKINKITTIHIQDCVNNMIKLGLTTSTIKTYLQKLNIFFNEAINQGIIQKNPISHIRYYKDKQSNTKTALTLKEQTRLLENISNPNHYLISLIALKTGARIGEILALTWNDIDFENNIIVINKQWNLNKKGEYSFVDVKGVNSNRSIPIPYVLVTELKKYKNKNPINIDNRIFKYKNTASTSSNLIREYVRIGFNISVHELRHTYATNLIQNGIDFKTTAKLLGHTVEMTLNVYSHVTDDMMKRATKIINNYF
ncbi:site-specific integrase [Clostridium botulinum]|uniref:site-specific integrase n=1 Tax=Clostridium botulinum TaxID=1491 RepID=UPI000773C4DC|nr:tyrosine-type recombinase/integrase [Clostridium botulinum]NFL87286.1 site-specific integrase [Clostridium botulinum]NFO22748.1 site-specific integrase [Clostridium botulinum]